MLSLVRMPGKWCVQLIAVICPHPPPSLSCLLGFYLFPEVLQRGARERERQLGAAWIIHAGLVFICLLSVCVCLSLTQSPSPAVFAFASVRRVCRRHLLFGLASRLQMGTKVDCAWNWAVCMCVPVPVIADMLVPSTLISLPTSSLHSSSGAWELVIIN